MRIHWLVLLGSLFLNLPLHADAPTGYPFVAFDAGMRTAQSLQRGMFVYFGRHGCGYCDKTNKEAFSQPDVRERYTRNYVLVYVDAEGGRRLTLPSGERITERELGPIYRAFVTPVFAYLDPQGRVLLKRSGVQSAKDLLDYDRYVQGGHYEHKSLAEFLSDAS